MAAGFHPLGAADSQVHAAPEAGAAPSSFVRGLPDPNLELSTVFAGSLLANPAQGSGAAAPFVVPGPNYRMVLSPGAAELLAGPARGLVPATTAGPEAGWVSGPDNGEGDARADWDSVQDGFLDGVRGYWGRESNRQRPGRATTSEADQAASGSEVIPFSNNSESKGRSETESNGWHEGVPDIGAADMPGNVVDKSLANLLAIALIGAGATHPGALFGKEQEERRKPKNNR
jgi:hypothetical protein